MNSTTEPHYHPEDEIDLRELFATLWRGKWVIFLLTFVFAAGGVAYALYQPNVYTASALLAPASDETGSRVSGQLAGLASLAGVSLGGGITNKTAIAKEVLRSRAFLGDFIRRHDLAVPLMAAKAWDKDQKKWVIDTETYDLESAAWAIDDEGKTLAPTDWDLVKAFRELLSVSENKDNGMITVALTSLSPVAAQDWVELLIKDLNDHMRDQEVAAAEASVKYLEDKLQETNIAGMQQVFYQLIENETRTIMLANAQREYIFKTIDPAVVPQEQSGPKRTLICVVATMLGGILGIFVVFMLSLSRSSANRTPDFIIDK